jgi:restriction system protein
MSIWTYADHIKDQELIRLAMTADACPFCTTALEQLRDDRETIGNPGEHETATDEFWTCPVCGWWKAAKEFRHTEYGFSMHNRSGAAAALRTLDLSDISVPVADARNYLMAKFDDRSKLAPRQLELIVASIFRDHGFQAEATAYSGDDRIDVILRDSAGRQIGVQAKRYKDAIEIEQIRSFAGALFLEGHTRGIFVTTSRFTSGAPKVARKSELRGIPIELMDAPAFFDALKIAQREQYRTTRDLQTVIDSNAFVVVASSSRRRF